MIYLTHIFERIECPGCGGYGARSPRRDASENTGRSASCADSRLPARGRAQPKCRCIYII